MRPIPEEPASWRCVESPEASDTIFQDDPVGLMGYTATTGGGSGRSDQLLNLGYGLLEPGEGPWSPPLLPELR